MEQWNIDGTSGEYQFDGTNGTLAIDRPVEGNENVPSPKKDDGTLMERWNVGDHHDENRQKKKAIQDLVPGHSPL